MEGICMEAQHQYHVAQLKVAYDQTLLIQDRLDASPLTPAVRKKVERLINEHQRQLLLNIERPRKSQFNRLIKYTNELNQLIHRNRSPLENCLFDDEVNGYCSTHTENPSDHKAHYSLSDLFNELRFFNLWINAKI